MFFIVQIKLHILKESKDSVILLSPLLSAFITKTIETVIAQ